MPIWRTTVRTQYAAPGGPGYMTFHFRDTALTTPDADLQNATDGLEDAFRLLINRFPPSTSFDTDGVWQDVDGDSEVDVTGWSFAGASGVSGGLMPGNVSVVCGWRTESRSRSGRGRTFVSGWPTQASIDGTPTGEAITAMQAFGSSIVQFNADNDGAFVVWSPTQGIGRDITGRQVRDVWASLRSRRD